MLERIFGRTSLIELLLGKQIGLLEERHLTIQIHVQCLDV